MATNDGKTVTDILTGNGLVRDLARYGAERRVTELTQELDDIHAAFPEIRDELRRKTLAANAAIARQARLTGTTGKKKAGRPKGSKNKTHDEQHASTV